MKREDLKKIIYSRYAGYILRIPLFVECSCVTTNVPNVDMSPHATYKRTGLYIYDENMVKMFQYSLWSIGGENE